MTGVAQGINEAGFEQCLRPGTHPEAAVAGVVRDGEDLDFHDWKLLKEDYQLAAGGFQPAAPSIIKRQTASVVCWPFLPLGAAGHGLPAAGWSFFFAVYSL
jgi:hypothetical protein